MKQGIICLAMMGLACFVRAADDALGFWVLNGAAGTSAEGVLANRVTDSPLTLCAAVTNSSSGTAQTPVFTNDVPGRYLFDSMGYTNLLATNTACIHLSRGDTLASGCLLIPKIGEELAGRDFTIELFYSAEYNEGYDLLMGLSTTGGSNIWSTAIFSTSHFGGGLASSKDAQHWIASNQTVKPMFSNGWHHCALTYKKDTKKLTAYLDYKRVVTETLDIDPAMDGNSVFLTAAGLGYHAMKQMRVSALRVFARTLTANEFMAILNTETPGTTIGYWRLEGTTGQSLPAWMPMDDMDRSDNVLRLISPSYLSVTNAVWCPYVQKKMEATPVRNHTSMLSDRPASGTGGALGINCAPCMIPSTFTVESFVQVTSTNNGAINKECLIFGEPGVAQGSVGWALKAIPQLNRTSTLQLNFRKVKVSDQSVSEYNYHVYNVTNGVWHHVAVTYAGETKVLKLWVDYAERFSVPIGDDFVLHRAVPDLEFRLVQGLNNTQSFPGMVDEFRYSRVVLAPEQFLSAKQPRGTFVRMN